MNKDLFNVIRPLLKSQTKKTKIVRTQTATIATEESSPSHARKATVIALLKKMHRLHITGINAD